MTDSVAVCFLSQTMVHASFALSLAQICAAHPNKDITVIPLNQKSSIIAYGRNVAVRDARRAKADYLLFLDSDMTFPVDTVEQLLSHRKDIVAATYTQRVPPYRVLGFRLNPKEPVTKETKLIEMKRIPPGCMLIRMRVFDILKRPYFKYQNDSGGNFTSEDYCFCDMARAAGIPIWCDNQLSQQTGHIGEHTSKFNGDWLKK